MSRNNNDEVDWEEYQIFDGGNRRFVKRDVDEPKRSPIRRKKPQKSTAAIQVRMEGRLSHK
jgi:hypothetical protein